ncbi:MAG: hypothetical protein AAF363_20000 [Bacteroidota bacterium]
MSKLISKPGKPAEAVEKYIGKESIQHNPDVPNGTQGFIDCFEHCNTNTTDKSIEFVICIAEESMIALHTHQTWFGNYKYVTMDFFKFDTHGKICEHWDSIQQIPKESVNPNTMHQLRYTQVLTIPQFQNQICNVTVMIYIIQKNEFDHAMSILYI